MRYTRFKSFKRCNGCKGKYLEETNMAKPIPTYIIKAELKDFRSPATWRRFKIKKNLPITELAYYLEIMFEMYAEHQYDFTYQSDSPVLLPRRTIMTSKI